MKYALKLITQRTVAWHSESSIYIKSEQRSNTIHKLTHTKAHTVEDENKNEKRLSGKQEKQDAPTANCSKSSNSIINVSTTTRRQLQTPAKLSSCKSFLRKILMNDGCCTRTSDNECQRFCGIYMINIQVHTICMYSIYTQEA